MKSHTKNTPEGKHLGGPVLGGLQNNPVLAKKIKISRPAEIHDNKSIIDTRSGLAWIAVAFFISLIIPNYFFIGSIRLSPLLIILIISLIPLLFMWISGKAGKIRIFDILILGSSLWSVLSLSTIYGFDALQPAGIVFIETFGAYLIGRVSIRSARDMELLLRAFFISILIMAPFAILESVTNNRVYLSIFNIFGPVYDDMIMEPRAGFFRAQVSFEHPILYGVFCASGLSLVFYTSKHGLNRIIKCIVVIIATFCSLSTGALLCLSVQISAFIWGFLFRMYENKWRVLIIIVVLTYIAIDILSNRSPPEVFVSYLTFNVGSAYNRILIWTYGSAEVARHPFFGIGYEDWIRPSWMHGGSVDMFWLLIALRYGIPASLMLAAGSIILMISAGKNHLVDIKTRQIRSGLIIGLIAVFVSIWSVHLWKATFCWMMLLIGCLGWLTETEKTIALEEDAAGSNEGVSTPSKPRTWM